MSWIYAGLEVVANVVQKHISPESCEHIPRSAPGLQLVHQDAFQKLSVAINSSVCGVASNRKGCDIGYGLAANSCEGVNSVDTCTVTALDAITAFAVPNPGGILAEQSVFSGLVVPRVALMNGSLSLFQTGCVLRSQSFSAVDIRDTSR